MKFWFCETCGKRLTDADIDAGAARDKKLKGVFCKDCAVGVLTMEMIPLNETQAKKILKQHEQGEPAADKGSPRRSTGEKGSNRAMQPAAADSRKPARTRAAAEGVKPGVMIAAAAGAFVLVIVAVLAFGGKTTPAPAPAVEPPAKVATVQQPAPAPTAPQPLPEPVPATPTPPAPVRQPDTPAPEPDEKSEERRARHALDAMRAKYLALPNSDVEGRTKLLEAYLAEYGHNSAAAEARRILDAIKKDSENTPPTRASTAPAPKSTPAIPAAAKTLAEEIRKKLQEQSTGQDPMAEVWKEALPLLRARQFNQAQSLVERKQKAMPQVPAELFEEEVQLVRGFMAFRQQAWDHFRKDFNKPIPVWCNNTQVMAVPKATSNYDITNLAVNTGVEMQLTRAQFDPRDVDTYAPEGNNPKENLKRRGVLWLIHDDPAKAAEYFVKARDAGLDAKLAERLLARAGVSPARDAAGALWNKGEAEFAAENWRQAEILYQQFQKQHPGQKTRELEQRMALLSEILYQPVPGILTTFFRGKGFNDSTIIETRIEDRIEINRTRKLPQRFPATNVSARFEGMMKVSVDGPYLMRLNVSGPARLVIDDKQIMEQPSEGAKDATVTLKEGLHPFRITAIHGEGDALFEFSASSTGKDGAAIEFVYDPRSDAPLAMPDAAPPASLLRGAVATFFDGTTFDGKKVWAGVDMKIDFDWGRRAPHDRLPTEKYCARWQAKLKVEQSGMHTFHVNADDGIRLVVGGKTLVDAISVNAGERSRCVWLTPGLYDFMVEYVQRTGDATCIVAWELPGAARRQQVDTLFFPAPAPPEQLPPEPALDVPESELVRGWVGRYYRGLKFEDAALVMTRVDKEMSLTWGRFSPIDQQLDEFCIRWTGKLKVEKTGRYRMRGTFNDGATLWIDGKQVFSNWKVDGSDAAAGVSLTKGYHDVTLDFFEGFGLAWFKLFWSQEGGFADTEVPGSAMFHHPSQLKK